MVVNPARGLLAREISEEHHLQSSNESMKTKTKTKQKQQKERNNNTKHRPEKDRRRVLGRESLVYRQPRAIRYPPPPDRNYLEFAPKDIVSTAPYSRSFRFLCRHSRHRLGSTWVGSIDADLKYLKLAATVTPGTTSTLSASSAYLFLCRCSDAFSSSFTHVAINL